MLNLEMTKKPVEWNLEVELTGETMTIEAGKGCVRGGGHDIRMEYSGVQKQR